MSLLIRLTHSYIGSIHRVRVEIEGLGSRQTATSAFQFEVEPADRENLRWYLEDFLEYPADPAPTIAADIEKRLEQIGSQLFDSVFGKGDLRDLWTQVRNQLELARVEVAEDLSNPNALPWELLRDSKTGIAVALQAASFVRTHHQPARQVAQPTLTYGDQLRVLLVICRPAGREDVPFRSVSGQLVRAGAETRLPGLDLSVLRPPTFAQLSRVLTSAATAGRPYHVVHFDGHGAFLDLRGEERTDDGEIDLGLSPLRYGTVAPVRQGPHGYLIFEDRAHSNNQVLVDGGTLGALLTQTQVPVLLLNACRSAYSESPSEPIPDGSTPASVANDDEMGDVHSRIRAFGSLATEVADAGVPGVVAMRFNVYVVTAAQFVSELYSALLAGRTLGEAVAAARRNLARNPSRRIGFETRSLQDWSVPEVFESAQLRLFSPTPENVASNRLKMDAVIPSQSATASGSTLPRRPEIGFFGRDETLLSLDRAFDTQPTVLLHALAGSGKTSTAVEFSRWYVRTGGLAYSGGDGPVLFTSFEHYRPLDRVLDQIGETFDSILQANEVHWYSLGVEEKRALAIQILSMVPVLWIWDNVEPITGFPAGASTPWSEAEQHQLAELLRDLADTNCKVLLTSRRAEEAWLRDVPARVDLRPMPMLESFQLLGALAERRGQPIEDIPGWRALLRYAGGNPLTILILAGQALRERLASRSDIEEFLNRIRHGYVALDTKQDKVVGRSESLAASLGYGLANSFANKELAQLAVLHLFHGTVAVYSIIGMGFSENPYRVPQLADLSLEAGISLLDRAAEIGLLTSVGAGSYAIHPALPWYFTTLFSDIYGDSEHPDARRALSAFVSAMGEVGNMFAKEYQAGQRESIELLAAEEQNLTAALTWARSFGLWNAATCAANGLHTLYEYRGRMAEWSRIVDELTNDLIDPVSDGPHIGREDEWIIVTQFRVALAQSRREWDKARRLQEMTVSWQQQHVDAFRLNDYHTLDKEQRKAVRDLAICIERLGHIDRQQQRASCVPNYMQAIELFDLLGDRHAESVVAGAVGNAYAHVRPIQDLEQAAFWFQRSFDLRAETDRIGRGKNLARLAQVDYMRFTSKQGKGTDAELLEHLNDAIRHSAQALQMFPNDDFVDLAALHSNLGLVFHSGGEIELALFNYTKAIQLAETIGSTYDAGGIRYNVADMLAELGRNREALLYARASLRDYLMVGAAASSEIKKVEQLIATL